MKDIRYAKLIIINGRVSSANGYDTNSTGANITTSMEETEALNKLGKLGYKPYHVDVQHIPVPGTGLSQATDKFTEKVTYRLHNNWPQPPVE